MLNEVLLNASQLNIAVSFTPSSYTINEGASAPGIKSKSIKPLVRAKVFRGASNSKLSRS